MKFRGRSYSQRDLRARVGSIAQLGGTRHYTLCEGRAAGVHAVDSDTGSGFRYTVLPDRGLDISLASYKGANLVHLTANGEVHPAYYEPQGLGWLRTFGAGLLTTCGLTNLGPPCNHDGAELGLHGRYANSPASRVSDLSGWEGDEYVLKLRGVVEETVLFGDKIRFIRTISSPIGSKSLHIHDVAENFGFQVSPFAILYHINAGFPLLDEMSKLVLSARATTAYEEWANIDDLHRFSPPTAGCREENFHHTMASDEGGWAYCAMVNPALGDGLGLWVQFKADTLPFMNEWKMMGQGDYVVGMEPCNVPCQSRAALAESGMLATLAPGETREMDLTIGVLEGSAEIAAFTGHVEEICRRTSTPNRSCSAPRTSPSAPNSR
jgi:hypothetical protein